MNAGTLLAIVRFHAWANDRILTTAAGLSDDEFRRTAQLDNGSAFQTLRHLMDVDWSWREFCNGNNVGQTGHSPGDLDLLDALTLRWPGDPD